MRDPESLHETRKNIENAICIDVCMKYEYDMNIGLYDKR